MLWRCRRGSRRTTCRASSYSTASTRPNASRFVPTLGACRGSSNHWGQLATDGRGLVGVREDFASMLLARRDEGLVATRLAGVLATTTPRRHVMYAAPAADLIREQLNDCIREMRIRLAEDADGHGRSPLVDAAQRLATFVALLSAGEGRADVWVDGLDEAHLEPESKGMVWSALRYRAYVHDVVSWLPEPHAAPDLAPSVQYLGKAFEYEMNLSVAQEARRRLGIPMPRCFNEHSPTHGSLAAVPRADMNMKAKNSGCWKSPGLEKVRETMKALRKQGPFVGAHDELLLFHWDALWRNGIVHRIRRTSSTRTAFRSPTGCSGSSHPRAQSVSFSG